MVMMMMRGRRNVRVNFTSLASDPTSGILLTGRLSVAWKIRVWVSKKDRGKTVKSFGLSSERTKEKKLRGNIGPKACRLTSASLNKLTCRPIYVCRAGVVYVEIRNTRDNSARFSS